MSNVATLTLKGVSDLKTIQTDLRGVASAAQQVKTPLDSVGKSMDSATKSTTSFGQKIKNFGSTFSSSIASIGTLGGTVLNLSRQYQDLGDSQIAVDKAQLKVSKTTEAVGVAQGKLNALTAKGVTSGAEYQQAILDVKQAQEAQSLAEQMLTERQEDHQRAQENFWIGLVPTVTSAGTSIIAVLKDIGGTKGIGGLKTALSGLKGAFSVFSGGGGLASGLTGIGSAASGSVGGINGMATATTGLGGAMKATALSMLPVVLALGGAALAAKAAGMVIHEIISIMKGDMLEAVKSMQSLIDFYTKIGSVIPMGGGFAIFTALKPEVAKLRAELEKVPQTIKPVSAELQRMDDIGKGMSGTIDNIIGGVLGLTKKADAATPALNNAGGAITGLGTATSTAAPAVTKLNTGLGAMKFPSAAAAVFDTYIKNWGSQTMPQLSKSIATIPPALQFLNTWLNTVVGSTNAFTASTARAKAQAAQLTPVLAKATAAFKNLTIAQGGTPSKKSQPQFGPLHGNPVKGAANPNFRLKPDWQKAKIVKAASGMHEMVNSPTWILAGEAGKERVDIGSAASGNGGGTTIVNVYLDGDRIDQGIRYRINKFQSAF